jgi:hypothetical protein
MARDVEFQGCCGCGMTVAGMLTTVLRLRNFEFHLVGPDGLAAQGAEVSSAIAAPDAVRVHSRQAAILEAFTRGALQIKFSGHSWVALAFRSNRVSPKRWATHSVFCSNATVRKCKELCNGSAMRLPARIRTTSFGSVCRRRQFQAAQSAPFADVTLRRASLPHVIR